MKDVMPCPFHTDQAKYLEPRVVEYLNAVCCDICGAQGPSASTKEIAVEMWNTRHTPHEAEIAALRAELDKLKAERNR